jgi:hypothetical protein
MPYKVLVPELNVLHKLGELVDSNGKLINYEHETVLYIQDELVPDNKISPVIVHAYDDGDDHTLSVLERVDEVVEEVKPAPAKRGRPKAEPASEE